MLVERYLSNKEHIGMDDNGFLIGDISRQVDSVTGIVDYVYSLEDYSRISDIIKNPFTIIVGNGGLGKSVLLDQISSCMEENKHSYCRIDLRSLVKEDDLFTNINNFLTNITTSDEEIYILLDAIDEAIDHGIRNPIELIAQDIRRTLEIHSKCKFIITSRSQVNNIESLSVKLLKIYNIEQDSNRYIYQLCPFTLDNVKSIAKTDGITDIEGFLQDIQKFSLGSFLATPITCKTVINLYKDNKINDNTNHYDIYFELTSDLCKESSEYRISQAADSIGKFRTFYTDELLFVAAKLAIELKVNNKTFLTTDEKDKEQCVFVKDFYNLSIKTKFHKHLKFTEENINAVLNSKLFYKTENKYVFCQKTYFDFLCAYYLFNIDINIKEFTDLFIFENKLHPNYYEVASLLAMRDKKFLDYFLKKNPEALIFSSIVFNDSEVNKQLLIKLINIVKNNEYNHRKINIYATYKKLSFIEAKEIILKAFKSKNEDVLTLAVEYIHTNKLNGFNKQLKQIIFNNKYSSRLKMYAVLTAKENLSYKDVIEYLSKKLDLIQQFFEQDEKNNLRAVVLEALYPAYIDDKTLLSYIVPMQDTGYYGWYSDYIRKEFLNSKYINKDNVLLFTKWILNNEIYGITREEHCHNYSKYYFPDNIKKFFVTAVNFINNKEVLDEIIKYQAKVYTKTCACHFKVLFEKITANNCLRLYTLKKYIEVTNNDIYLSFVDEYLFISDDIGYLMALYHKETNMSMKSKYKTVINRGYYKFLYSNNIKDIQYIFNVFKAYPELKKEFSNYSLTKCFISPITGEPVGKYARGTKNYYLEDLKRQEEHKRKEKERLKKQQFCNDVLTRIKNNINSYNKTKNSGHILNIFAYLIHKHDDAVLCYGGALDFASMRNWNKLDECVKTQIIDVCLDYLKENKAFGIDKDLKTYIEAGSQLVIWNCLGALLFFKQQKKLDEYYDLLKKHKMAILYFKYSDKEEKILRELTLDLYKNETEFVKAQIEELLNLDLCYISHYTDVFNKFTLLKDEFFDYLYFLYKQNKDNLPQNANISIIHYLVSKNNVFGINVCMEQIKKNMNDASFPDNEVLMSFLKNLLRNFQPEYWGLIKKVFYKNKNGVNIFKRVAGYFDYHQGACINYRQISNHDLVEFYIWIGRHIPKREFESGCYDYRHEEHIENEIYNFWINSGNYKCIRAIRKTMSNKNAYKRSYNMVLNQYLLNKQVDIQKFKKLENKTDKKLFFLFNIDNSITTGNITNSKIGQIGHNN